MEVKTYIQTEPDTHGHMLVTAIRQIDAAASIKMPRSWILLDTDHVSIGDEYANGKIQHHPDHVIDTTEPPPQPKLTEAEKQAQALEAESHIHDSVPPEYQYIESLSKALEQMETAALRPMRAIAAGEDNQKDRAKLEELNQTIKEFREELSNELKKLGFSSLEEFALKTHNGKHSH